MMLSKAVNFAVACMYAGMCIACFKNFTKVTIKWTEVICCLPNPKEAQCLPEELNAQHLPPNTQCCHFISSWTSGTLQTYNVSSSLLVTVSFVEVFTGLVSCCNPFVGIVLL